MTPKSNGVSNKLLALSLIALLGSMGLQSARSATYEQGEASVRLLDMHNQYDESGLPIWYFPVDLKATAWDTLAELQELNFAIKALRIEAQATSKETIKLLERIAAQSEED